MVVRRMYISGSMQMVRTQPTMTVNLYSMLTQMSYGGNIRMSKKTSIQKG